MERVEIIYCRVLMSTLRGRFDYVTLHFCGLLLGFVDDCTITGCYVSPPLIQSESKAQESGSGEGSCKVTIQDYTFTAT